jgi:chaperone modulatory protein CbpM
MITIVEVLQRLGDMPDRVTLEVYIARAWVRPVQKDHDWRFEEIDIARIRLVHHLRRDMMVNDEAMDVVLHLLDQVYGLREQMRRLHHVTRRLPRSVQAELESWLKEMDEEYTDV